MAWVCGAVYLVFFFSSRRRHTRLQGDWSSDVCSSDLVVGAGFMGSGIAGTAIAQAGVDVRMKDADLPRVAKGLAAAREILDDRLKRRRITQHEHARLVALLSGSEIGRAHV